MCPDSLTIIIFFSLWCQWATNFLTRLPKKISTLQLILRLHVFYSMFILIECIKTPLGAIVVSLVGYIILSDFSFLDNFEFYMLKETRLVSPNGSRMLETPLHSSKDCSKLWAFYFCSKNGCKLMNSLTLAVIYYMLVQLLLH